MLSEAPPTWTSSHQKTNAPFVREQQENGFKKDTILIFIKIYCQTLKQIFLVLLKKQTTIYDVLFANDVTFKIRAYKRSDEPAE